MRQESDYVHTNLFNRLEVETMVHRQAVLISIGVSQAGLGVIAQSLSPFPEVL